MIFHSQFPSILLIFKSMRCCCSLGFTGRQSLVFRMCIRECLWDKLLGEGEGGTGLHREWSKQGSGPPSTASPKPTGSPEAETACIIPRVSQNIYGFIPLWGDFLQAAFWSQRSWQLEASANSTPQQQEHSPSLKGDLSSGPLYSPLLHDISPTNRKHLHSKWCWFQQIVFLHVGFSDNFSINLQMLCNYLCIPIFFILIFSCALYAKCPSSPFLHSSFSPLLHSGNFLKSLISAFFFPYYNFSFFKNSSYGR